MERAPRSTNTSIEGSQQKVNENFTKIELV